uniref:C-type lectin domain-containing protein n=1 Tax=Anser brachyrhynchus TaxID=132585 RepID=A0A8B9BIW9_9AVES
MAVTTVYTDLEMPQGPGGIPQLPKPPGRRWYWAILGAGWVGAAVLAGIVLWLLQRHDGNSLNPTGSCSWEPCPGKGTSSSNRSLNCFQLGLRERLCEAESHQAPGAEGCWLCPTGWQPFATKCYRISAKTLPWNEAGGDCKDRRAELVMLKSVEEKDFIGAMSKEIAGSWTGLSTIPTQGEGWTWMDGSPLQDDLLQVMGERRVNACASMWKGQLRSHTCGTPLHWICQKEATKI